ncbi:hypothetical protein MMC29_007361 [Sticta canariensis]|nr:hypothetical protein [Sticta canariensis]
MPDGQLLRVNTSSPGKSIWRGLDRDRFRTNIVALQRASNQVPCDPKIHVRNEWHNPKIRHNDPSYVLPFEVEQRLADDFALIAAAKEGVKAVSAVALEESLDPAGLTIRLAANETLPERVPDTFKMIFNLLQKCAKTKLLPKSCAEEIFEHVVTLSQERLHGRLQSRQWNRPKHLSRRPPKPLHQELRNAPQKLFQGPPSAQRDFSSLVKKLNGLCDSYELLDNVSENAEQVQMLKEIVRKSHDFCTSGGACTLEETIRNFGLNPSLVCADKRMQQVNKIGRYWGLCVHVAKRSKEYGKLFENLNLRVLQAYQSINSSISSVAGKVVPCFVHAEVQLITFYGLNANAATRKPRVLGVSKSACYLCSLFVLFHGQYFITKTHGHLYDHWNVPDLASYKPNQLDDYRRVLADMNKKVIMDLAEEKRGGYRRRHPMTSSVNLPKGQTFSPLPSDVGTLISNGSSNPDHALTLPPIRSLVLPTEQQDASISLAQTPMLNDEPVTGPNPSSSPLRPAKLTRASSSSSSSSIPLNESPSTNSDIGVPPPFSTAQNPKSPNSSSGSGTSSPPITFVNKIAQPTTSPQRSSSPSAVPKSSSSSSNDSDPSTPSPTLPKKNPQVRTSLQRSSSLSAAPESSSSSSTNSHPRTPRVEPPPLNIQPNTLRPSSPPPKPISSRSVLSSQSAKSAVTASHPGISNSPVYSSTENSRLLSSTSIASRQLPVSKDISRDSPIRVSSGRISTEILFQGPGQGKVRVQKIENPGVSAAGRFINLEALLPNQSLLLERAETDDQLALILQYQRRSLRLDIRWH